MSATEWRQHPKIEIELLMSLLLGVEGKPHIFEGKSLTHTVIVIKAGIKTDLQNLLIAIDRKRLYGTTISTYISFYKFVDIYRYLTLT